MAKHRPECFFTLARGFSPTTLKWSPRSLSVIVFFNPSYELVPCLQHYSEFKFLEASYREDIDTGTLPGHATKYFGSYVIGEDSMFWRNTEGGVKISKTRRKANSGSPNYLSAASCKSCNQRRWRAFILICTASKDVASTQDGWSSSAEWSQA